MSNQQSYNYAYASGSAAASSSSDPYAPFYSWDAVSNQWVFDYDSYYRTYPQAAAAASANANAAAYNFADLTAQAAAYDYNGTAGAGTMAGPGYSGQTGADGKPKKFIPGPKDEEGNPIAGKLKKGETRATVLRKAAGKVWEDQTLLDWDPTHKRLFIGDLGNDVTDEVLTAAFQKYPSFSKARVVRKKGDENAKSKGYGFVAFADPEDFLKAWKEMDGKYVGSRPIRIKKAQTDAAHVDIGYRKDRLLASNNRYEAYLHKTKMGGAIGKDLRNTATGKAYGQKR